MVKYSDAALDRTFAALADPTRRALIGQLGERQTVSVSELAKPFPVSLPAIMKHLDVPAERRAHGAGDGMAQSLPAILVRQSRPPSRLPGGGYMLANNPGIAT